MYRREDLVDQMEALEVFKKQHEEDLQSRIQNATSAPQQLPPQLGRKASMFHIPSSSQLMHSNSNLTSSQSMGNLQRTGSNLTSLKKAGQGDALGNTNYIFLQVTDRNGANKGMEYWIKKVRTNASTMRTYELLRFILQQQRRRHLLDITAKHTRRTVCPVRIIKILC